MESDANTNYSEYRHQFSSANTSQNNSGLLKYRSAPSFLLENFTNGVEKGERLTSRLFFDDANSMHELKSYNTCNSKGSVNGFAALNSQLPPQYPRQNGTQLGSLAVDGGAYRVVNSMGMDHQGQGNICSNILRQNSTPAGLFSHLTPQHGYASVRGTGSYRMTDSGSNGDLSPPSSSRLINRLNFSCGMPSSLGMLSQITEVENENTGVNNGPDDLKVGNGSGDSLFYSSGFPFSSWNDSSNFAENFCSGIKRELDDDQKLFGHTQNGEPENRPHILSRRLSLPKTSSEIAAMEKLLQLQDTVPCKVRAKRGCATHPRSIAERVRRTRISERMRKLQELVPNMDKQTNTADMLDLAVEYIKNLQKQYKTLSDNRANCKCSASQKTTVLNQMPWKEE